MRHTIQERAATDVLNRSASWALTGALLLTACFWLLLILHYWYTTGWFGRIGFDFGCFWSATRAFIHTGPASAYDVGIVHQYGTELARLSGRRHPTTYATGVSPYPPPFFLLIAPFTQARPVLDFLIWTVCNVALILWVAIRLAVGSPGRRWQIALGALLASPVMEGLILGQPTGFLLLILYQCWHSLEQKRDLRAGLWAGLLLLKPQYALPLIVIMLLKRRWGFVRGVTLVGLGLGCVSFMLLGFSGIASYVHLLRAVSSESSGLPGISFRHMMNWQAILINNAPTISASMRMIGMGLLDLASIISLACVWRGSWVDDPEMLGYRLLATMIVTLLISNHSYVHGAALLVVPCLAIRRGQPWTSTMRTLLLAGLFLPPAMFVLTVVRHWDWWVVESETVLALMLAGFVVSSVCIRALGRESRARLPRGLPFQESAFS